VTESDYLTGAADPRGQDFKSERKRGRDRTVWNHDRVVVSLRVRLKNFPGRSTLRVQSYKMAAGRESFSFLAAEFSSETVTSSGGSRWEARKNDVDPE